MSVPLTYMSTLVLALSLMASAKGDVDWRESLLQRIAQANQSRKQVPTSESGFRAPSPGNQYPRSQSTGSRQLWARPPPTNSRELANSRYNERTYGSPYWRGAQRTDFSRLSDWRNRFVGDSQVNGNSQQEADLWSRFGSNRPADALPNINKNELWRRFGGSNFQQREIWSSNDEQSDEGQVKEHEDWKERLLQGISQRQNEDSILSQGEDDWKDRLYQMISARRSEKGLNQDQESWKERLYQIISERRSGNSQNQDQNDWNDSFLQSLSSRKGKDSYQSQDAWKDRLLRTISARRSERIQNQDRGDWQSNIRQMMSGRQGQSYLNQDQGDQFMSLFSGGSSGDEISARDFKSWIDRAISLAGVQSSLKGFMPPQQMMPF
ncbi:hypothetical protein BgiMline_019568 [Biomphalaria glabrata]|nr:hypothetical protein BgiMline_033276 [Biomphalaria glabrata]KAI8741772.1 hypothetical protein BgiBS90_034748 [Biomphalaria glabrata]